MQIKIRDEQVGSVERALEILDEARSAGNSELIGRCLYALTQIGPGTPAADAATVELEERWARSIAAANELPKKPPEIMAAVMGRQVRSAVRPPPTVTVMGEEVSTVERINEMLDAARIAGDSERIGRCLLAITQIAPGTPEAMAANVELGERWEKSRAEAKARTSAGNTAGGSFDPYASQRHKRGRKSHLAAAINQSIHDNPAMGCVWYPLLLVLLVGCFVMVALGK